MPRRHPGGVATVKEASAKNVAVKRVLVSILAIVFAPVGCVELFRLKCDGTEGWDCGGKERDSSAVEEFQKSDDDNECGSEQLENGP